MSGDSSDHPDWWDENTGGSTNPDPTAPNPDAVLKTFAPFLPGQDALLAQQLAKGYGAGTSGDVGQYLSNLYKPMTIPSYPHPPYSGASGGSGSGSGGDTGDGGGSGNGSYDPNNPWDGFVRGDGTFFDRLRAAKQNGYSDPIFRRLSLNNNNSDPSRRRRVQSDQPAMGTGGSDPSDPSTWDPPPSTDDPAPTDGADPSTWPSGSYRPRRARFNPIEPTGALSHLWWRGNR